MDNTGEMVVIMTRGEAEVCIERIRAGINAVRADVLRLYEGEGWRALGYASWRECVVSEFGQSQSRLYQLLTAARIEREISTNVETAPPIPESHLRELARLPDAETRRAVWQEARATHGDNLTAATIRAMVPREVEVGDLPDIPPVPRESDEERAAWYLFRVAMGITYYGKEKIIAGLPLRGDENPTRDIEILDRCIEVIDAVRDHLRAEMQIGPIRRVK